jgi:hypothetical protein
LRGRIKEIGQRTQYIRINPAFDALALAPCPDQAGAVKFLEVMRHRRWRYTKVIAEVTHAFTRLISGAAGYTL